MSQWSTWEWDLCLWPHYWWFQSRVNVDRFRADFVIAASRLKAAYCLLWELEAQSQYGTNSPGSMAATHKNWQQSVSGNVANGVYFGTSNVSNVFWVCVAASRSRKCGKHRSAWDRVWRGPCKLVFLGRDGENGRITLISARSVWHCVVSLTSLQVLSQQQWKYSVQIMNQSKKSEYSMEKFVYGCFSAIDTLKEMLHKLCPVKLPESADIQVGYIIPGHGLRGKQEWLCNNSDLKYVYACYEGKKEILLWCFSITAKMFNLEKRKNIITNTLQNFAFVLLWFSKRKDSCCLRNTEKTPRQAWIQIFSWATTYMGKFHRDEKAFIVWWTSELSVF